MTLHRVALILAFGVVAHAIELPAGCDWLVDGDASLPSSSCNSTRPVCASITDAVSRANSASGQVICVVDGTYYCDGIVPVWDSCGSNPSTQALGVITSSMTITGLGLGAIIDCQGSHSGLFIVEKTPPSGILNVTIERLHFRNANSPCAGAIWSRASRALTVRGCSFVNCTGMKAGAISWEADGTTVPASNTLVILEDITIQKCHGLDAASAGGISLYVGWEGDNNHNVFKLRNVRISNSTAGTQNQAREGSNAMERAAAGGIAITVYGTDGIYGSGVWFEGVTVTDCLGGWNTLGGAGGIAVTYYGGVYWYSSFRYNASIGGTTTWFQDVWVTRSKGGDSTWGAGAGGISVTFFSFLGHREITKYSTRGNTVKFSNVNVTHCSGGQLVAQGATGAGGVSIAYHGGARHLLNSVQFSKISIEDCQGGDWSQGAGGLSVYTGEGSSILCSLSFAQSLLRGNRGGLLQVSQNGVGSAGGGAIYHASSVNSTLTISDSIISGNIGCAGSTCEAGGLSVFGATVSMSRTVLEHNTSPAQAGALYGFAPMHLSSCRLRNNSASIFGTARLGLLSTELTEFWFPDTVLGLTAEIHASGANLLMRCSVGEYLKSAPYAAWPRQSQYKCEACPKGKYNLEASQWAYGTPVQSCLECPEDDTSKVICSGGSEVVSQPGFFLVQDSSECVLTLHRCPDPSACLASSVHMQQCKAGYTGVNCAECESDWFSPQMSPLICKSCPDQWLALTIELLLPVVVFSLSIYSANAKYEPDNNAILPSLFKMIIVHGTILETVEHVNWAWKDSVRSLLHLQASTSGSVADFSLRCITDSDYVTQFTVTLLVPWALLVLLVLLAGAFQLFGVHWFGGFQPTFCTFAVSALYLFVPPCIAKMLTVFPCYHAGEATMVYDPPTECGAYPGLIVFAVGAIVVTVVLTGYKVGYGLIRNKEAIETMISGTYDDTDHRGIHHEYGFLFRGFKLEYFYWETLVLARKSAVLVLATLTPPTFAMPSRTLLLLFLIVLSLIGSTLCRPYRYDALNTLDILVQACSCCSVLLAQYVESLDTGSDNLLSREHATVLCLVINILAVGPVFVYIVKHAEPYGRSVLNTLLGWHIKIHLDTDWSEPLLDAPNTILPALPPHDHEQIVASEVALVCLETSTNEALALDNPLH